MTAKGTNEFWEAYKHPNWQRRRLEILDRDGYKCLRCDDQNSTLHVHHLIYRRGWKPWEYDDKELVTLCEDCHELVTKQSDAIKEALCMLGPMHHERVLGYIHASCVILQRNSSLIAPGDKPAYFRGVIAARAIATNDLSYHKSVTPRNERGDLLVDRDRLISYGSAAPADYQPPEDETY